LATEIRAAAENEKTVILPCEHTKEYYVEDLGTVKTERGYAICKRLADIVFSVLALVVLALPMAVIAVIIKCTSEGPVFYHQERLGLNGKSIDVIKFRSMVMDAEKDSIQWSEGDEDPRITPIGHLLRKTRLDELPQFWCILKGEMSLVGPRPERPVFYREFEQYIHGFRERLKVKPGLTGLAQVRGGYYLMPEEKIVYDVEYIKTRSIWLDLKILMETVKVVCNHEGAK